MLILRKHLPSVFSAFDSGVRRVMCSEACTLWWWSVWLFPWCCCGCCCGCCSLSALTGVSTDIVVASLGTLDGGGTASFTGVISRVRGSGTVTPRWGRAWGCAPPPPTASHPAMNCSRLSASPSESIPISGTSGDERFWTAGVPLVHPLPELTTAAVRFRC